MQVQNIKEDAEILKQDMLIVDLLNCVLMGISMLRQEKKRALVACIKHWDQPTRSCSPTRTFSVSIYSVGILSNLYNEQWILRTVCMAVQPDLSPHYLQRLMTLFPKTYSTEAQITNISNVNNRIQ